LPRGSTLLTVCQTLAFSGSREAVLVAERAPERAPEVDFAPDFADEPPAARLALVPFAAVFAPDVFAPDAFVADVFAPVVFALAVRLVVPPEPLEPPERAEPVAALDPEAPADVRVAMVRGYSTRARALDA
jgi:hypothetical protein